MPQPDVSVVVTTFQRQKSLAALLGALARQCYPRDRFEVIVVNDGGAPLGEAVQAFETELQLRTIEQSNRGPASGRNTGAAQARGALLAFTDDDCEPAPGWLSTLKRESEAAPDCLLGGRTVGGFPAEPCSVANQMILDAVYGFYNARPGDARFFATNNMAVPVALFRSLGGFDARFRLASEDRDFCDRWRMSGLRLIHAAEAVVVHRQRLTHREFLSLHFRYGRGAARFHRERAHRRSSRFSEHFRMYTHSHNWLLRPWREAPLLRAAHLELLLLAWQVANAAGFIYGWLMDTR